MKRPFGSSFFMAEFETFPYPQTLGICGLDELKKTTLRRIALDVLRNTDDCQEARDIIFAIDKGDPLVYIPANSFLSRWGYNFFEAAIPGPEEAVSLKDPSGIIFYTAESPRRTMIDHVIIKKSEDHPYPFDFD